MATPSGTSIAVYPTDIVDDSIPEGGIYMLFGTDLQTNLQNSVKTNCGNNTGAQCFSNIHNVLQTDQDENTIQSRGVALYGSRAFGPVAAAFEAVYSALIFLWVMKSAQNHPIRLHIHLPSNVLGQIGAATKLNAAVIKTAANDASPVTVPISTAATTTTTTTSSSSATASTVACVEDDVTKMVKSAIQDSLL